MSNTVQGDPKEDCGLHVLYFPGSAEKHLIASRFGCLQCSEISDSTEELLIGVRWWLKFFARCARCSEKY